MTTKKKRNAEIVAQYLKGVSPDALSEAWGIERKTVLKIIGDARTEARGREILRRYEAGERPTDIAADLKFTPGQVTGFLKRNKALKPRPIGGVSNLKDRGVQLAPDFDWGRGFGGDDVKTETLGRMWKPETRLPSASSAVALAEV